MMHEGLLLRHLLYSLYAIQKFKTEKIHVRETSEDCETMEQEVWKEEETPII